MSRAVDRASQGFLIVQDHGDPDVPLSMRQSIAGCRVTKLKSPNEVESSDGIVLEYGRENEMGVLGNFEPWQFWQTKDRDLRGAGSWSMARASLTSSGGTGAGGGKGSKADATPSKILPVRRNKYDLDIRYAEKTPLWPKCLATLPQGVSVLSVPASEEDEQHDIIAHTDPRLFAVNMEGPASHGTLVVDLQPNGQPCMDGSIRPGLGGRHAPLQSHMRVIAMKKEGIAFIGVRPGNAIAWQLATSKIDRLAGYGLCYAALDSKPSSKTRKPVITPGKKQKQAITGGGKPKGPSPQEPEPLADAKALCDLGKFEPKPDEGHGLAFMASLPTDGPFHAGNIGDKHQIGEDRDGHVINAGHLSTDAFFYRDQGDDGPLDFEGDYPHPPRFTLRSRVHLTWDATKPHDFLAGQANGMWRWYAEVPYYSPDIPNLTPDKSVGTPIKQPTARPGFGSPGTPSRPGRGGPPGGGGGPGTGSSFGNPGANAPGLPGAGGGGPGTGGSERPAPILGPPPPSPNGPLKQSFPLSVGAVSGADTALYSIFHPIQETYSEIGFRPQLMVNCVQAFTHNPFAEHEEIAEDEATRPNVVIARAWGSQSDSGTWSYTARPGCSRARGGTANGGVLFTDPSFEMEDYFDINSAADVDVPTTTSFVAAAPGVSFALGEPNVDGGLTAGSATFGRVLAAVSANKPVALSILNSSRVATGMVTYELDQSTGDQRSIFGGTGYIVLPLGSTAQRPTAWVESGGEFRISSDAVVDRDTPEFYDTITAAWTSITTAAHLASTTAGEGAALVGIEDSAGNFTATNVEAALAEVKVISDAAMPKSGGTFTGGVTFEDPVTHEGSLVMEDNTKILLGTLTVDGEIYSDGTDLIIDPTNTADVRLLGHLRVEDGLTVSGANLDVDSAVDYSHDGNAGATFADGGEFTFFDGDFNTITIETRGGIVTGLTLT